MPSPIWANREKAIVEFIYSSGCRVSEAVQVDVNNIDFETRSVSIVGKGSKRRTIYFSVRAMSAFLQGLTTDLLLNLTYRDPESDKQIFRLVPDDEADV